MCEWYLLRRLRSNHRKKKQLILTARTLQAESDDDLEPAHCLEECHTCPQEFFDLFRPRVPWEIHLFMGRNPDSLGLSTCDAPSV